MKILGIDPGGKHCGVAYAERGECVWAKEYTPEGLFVLLEATTADLVVYESFALYPWKSKEQSFSQLEVVQTIGVLRYICWRREIRTVAQTPQIKIPIAAQLKARGYKYQAHGQGGHAKDAEYHLMYWLARNKKKGV